MMLSRREFKEKFKENLGYLPMDFQKQWEEYMNTKVLPPITCSTTVCLAPLPKAVPASTKLNGWKADWIIVDDVIKEEGKTPMRYNDNYASASANVTTIQSDTAFQRDYLLSRLAKADYPKENELRHLFNLYVDNTPRTYKELIDAIKNDKFTIDKKVEKKLEVAEESDEEGDFYFGGPFTGIIWSGPQPDRAGFEEAVKQKTNQFTAAKDIIVTDAAAGLKALQDFEAWLPTPATTVQ